MNEEPTVDTAAEAAPIAPTTVDPVPEPVQEGSDYVPAREAETMFKVNPGLAAVKVQVDDGRIGFLSRDGAFAPVAVGE